MAASFALVRYALTQNRVLSERFVAFLEGSLRRQEETNEGFRDAIAGLNHNLRDTSALLRRVAEKLL